MYDVGSVWVEFVLTYCVFVITSVRIMCNSKKQVGYTHLLVMSRRRYLALIVFKLHSITPCSVECFFITQILNISAYEK